MKRLNTIKAAEEGDSKLQDAMTSLKDDFDYLLSGLEKLDRSGAESSNDGLIIAEQLSQSIQQHIENIAEKIGG